MAEPQFIWTSPDPLNATAKTFSIYLTELYSATKQKEKEANLSVSSFVNALPAESFKKLSIDQLKSSLSNPNLLKFYGYKSVQEVLGRSWHVLEKDSTKRERWCYHILNDFRELLNKLKVGVDIIFIEYCSITATYCTGEESGIGEMGVGGREWGYHPLSITIIGNFNKTPYTRITNATSNMGNISWDQNGFSIIIPNPTGHTDWRDPVSWRRFYVNVETTQTGIPNRVYIYNHWLEGGNPRFYRERQGDHHGVWFPQFFDWFSEAIYQIYMAQNPWWQLPPYSAQIVSYNLTYIGDLAGPPWYREYINSTYSEVTSVGFYYSQAFYTQTHTETNQSAPPPPRFSVPRIAIFNVSYTSTAHAVAEQYNMTLNDYVLTTS